MVSFSQVLDKMGKIPTSFVGLYIYKKTLQAFLFRNACTALSFPSLQHTDAIRSGSASERSCQCVMTELKIYNVSARFFFVFGLPGIDLI